LNPGPPALEASTIPLGYRGGGIFIVIFMLINICLCLRVL